VRSGARHGTRPGRGGRRIVRPADEDAPVTEKARAERTARLLVARLDDLASAAARLEHKDAERLVELASVATINAVALEMLQADQAEEIWRDAHARHPELPEVVIELPRRLAA
jgi:hypothetical protein